MEVLQLAIAPVVAGLADVLLTASTRALFTRKSWQEYGKRNAIEHGQTDELSIKAWGLGYELVNTAGFALRRSIGIGLGLAGMVGALALNEPLVAYGFASLAGAEVIAASYDLVSAGRGGVKEYAWHLGQAFKSKKEDV